MTLSILSKDERTIAVLRQAINAEESPGLVEVLESDKNVLERLADQKKCFPAAVFVDLDGIPDAARLVEWLRFSPLARQFKVVAIGEECEVLARFRKVWGQLAALKKPLSVQTVRKVLTKASGRPRAERGNPGHAAKKKLVEAIENVKRLREAQGWLPAGAKKTSRKADRVAGRTGAIDLRQPVVFYVAENPADQHLFSAAMSQGRATFSVQFLQRFSDVLDHLREKGESRRITSDRPCCLLLDTANGGESACDILRWIRHQSTFPELLLVVMSQTDNPQMVKAFYRAGADYYLGKPKSFEGLIAIVNAIDAGLREAPPRFHGFIRLPEYRDAIGNAPAAGATGEQCAG